MKILVADDDLTSRRILEAVLTKWRFDVISAADGNEAWDKLQAPDSPKLAILDWMMPGMDGVEVCRRLRKKKITAATYIILLTARDDKKDTVEGLDAGADDYIVKPFNNDELRARINVGRRIIELQAALTENIKLQGVLEMAGAICHELNQPLMSISGYSELLLMDIPENKPQYTNIKKIKGQIDRLGEITRKLMTITRYKTKGYLKGKIIDINEASVENYSAVQNS